MEDSSQWSLRFCFDSARLVTGDDSLASSFHWSVYGRKGQVISTMRATGKTMTTQKYLWVTTISKTYIALLTVEILSECGLWDWPTILTSSEMLWLINGTVATLKICPSFILLLCQPPGSQVIHALCTSCSQVFSLLFRWSADGGKSHAQCTKTALAAVWQVTHSPPLGWLGLRCEECLRFQFPFKSSLEWEWASKCQCAEPEGFLFPLLATLQRQKALTHCLFFLPSHQLLELCCFANRLQSIPEQAALNLFSPHSDPCFHVKISKIPLAF